MMDQITDFIKRNYLMLLLGAGFFGAFYYFSMEGNRICDCQTTQKYSSASTGRAGVNRFYHK